MRHGHGAARRPSRGHAADRRARRGDARADDDRPAARRVLPAARARRRPGDELLRVEGLSSPAGSATSRSPLRAGEVLGFAGLVGAGRSEVAQALFGLDPRATGTRLRARASRSRSRIARATAMRAGHRPRARGSQAAGAGAVDERAGSNTTLPILARLSRLTFIRRRAERALARDVLRAPARPRAGPRRRSAAGLSGGNQQKLVLAKWLAAQLPHPDPRRADARRRRRRQGGDPRARSTSWPPRGNAVILISSELPEVLHLSTRIIVLREGRIAGELPRGRGDAGRGDAADGGRGVNA